MGAKVKNTGFLRFFASRTTDFVPCVTLLKALLSLGLREFMQKVHFYNFLQYIFSPYVAQKY